MKDEAHNMQTPKATIRRFKGYGLFGGATLGVLVGILVSGPHSPEWSVVLSLAVVGGFGCGGALIGYLILPQLSGALAGGGSSNPEQEDDRVQARTGSAGPEIGSSAD
ncbi:hypothetical protein FN976_18550 [Caenimonas sedimenti]|uniref:Uncharacterized protein n=1 Tax=Caenimonas sedimenti TaxID=2596921 RepID=A0A562ZNC1_9BURK|nr:hypothetical protein [Caenimonas sedimenti]TWO69818.1 hypothetical protein FN976_18550 [Caenimonas sedimenti]